MKVAFRLVHRTTSCPTSALLLPADDVAELLQMCSQLSSDSPPQIFRVADGFVLKLSKPHAAHSALSGIIRLRRLADDLLLPVDGELVPPLLNDEAKALVRDRGLIFLPGSRILEYAPKEPLRPGELLQVKNLQRPAWQPLPVAAAIAERLEEIRVEIPLPSPDELLDEGQGDIGSENPQPKDSSAPAKMMGKMTFNVGKGLAWLGQKLNVKGLSQVGAGMMAGALSWVPRLSESVLGKQEAMLRELLRQFREGNIEQALKRALPLSAPDYRGASVAQNANLPIHNLFYSLRNIMGQSGPASVWFGGSDEIYHQLRQEYRKQAEQAVQRGDFRRAAFIFAKLLGDFYSAANVLSCGGFHRDAAIIYLKKLHNSLSAAREYEAAGEFDKALELHRQRGDHLRAAELLRRIGEEDKAIAEYQLAARQLIHSGQGYYQAGELMLNKAGRTDLALSFYEDGWAARPVGSYLLCAQRVAELHLQEGGTGRIDLLMDEAEDFFAPAGNAEPAAGFFNHMARLAGHAVLTASRDELRDRCLLALANKMREQSGSQLPPARITSSMLHSSANWSDAAISDAQYALEASRRQAKEPQPRGVTVTRIPSRSESVTAVCHAPASGVVFIGFASGEVALFHPQRGMLMITAREEDPVLSLATNLEGENLVVLTRSRSGSACLSSYTKQSGYAAVYSKIVAARDEMWLAPVLASPAHGNVEMEIAALWNGNDLQFLASVSLLPLAHWDCDVETLRLAPEAVLLLSPFCPGQTTVGVILVSDSKVIFLPDWKKPSSHQDATLPWRSWLSAGDGLQHPHLSSIQKGADGLEIAGLRGKDYLLWSNLPFEDDSLGEVTTRVDSSHAPYLAATLIREGLVAAVTKSVVYWLRPGASGFRLLDSTAVDLPNAIACFPYSAGGQLIVVCSDGSVVQVPQRYT